ncbi:Glyceraldehyde 3-phosphate phosphatase [ANME-1 cluster archaeon GoMg2]|nr:Glyceraldehyde 3-phosphate phosphatase [ANME-1 cluster archaeon GoMg2]
MSLQNTMKTGRLEAILFDLDGVLINSFESWYQAFNTMLVEYRREKLTRDEFRATCWGPDLAHNLNALNLTDEAGKYCINEQLNLIGLIELFPGAKAVLSRLRADYKLKVGLVTNTPKENVNRILDYFQLFELFDVIVTGDDVRTGKPDAEMILKACETLSVKPEHAILVGDTEIDLLAGKSAGCSVICVKAKSAGDACIESLQELFAVLDK